MRQAYRKEAIGLSQGREGAQENRCCQQTRLFSVDRETGGLDLGGKD